MGLTAAELTKWRADFEALMPDEAAVLRSESVPDGQGGHTQQWATVDIYPCNAAEGPYMRFAAEQVIAGQTTPVGVIFLSLPHDADVRSSDRLDWLRAESDPVQLEVTQAGSRSWNVNTRVAAKVVG